MSTTNPNPNNPQLQGSLSTLQDGMLSLRQDISRCVQLTLTLTPPAAGLPLHPPGRHVITQTGHLQVSTTNPNPNNPQLQGSLSTLQDGMLSLRQDIFRCVQLTLTLTTPSSRAPFPPSRTGHYRSNRTSPGAYN